MWLQSDFEILSLLMRSRELHTHTHTAAEREFLASVGFRDLNVLVVFVSVFILSSLYL